MSTALPHYSVQSDTRMAILRISRVWERVQAREVVDGLASVHVPQVANRYATTDGCVTPGCLSPPPTLSVPYAMSQLANNQVSFAVCSLALL